MYSLFHHFFLPPLFVLSLAALYILKFPNQFFIFFRARVCQPLRRCHKGDKLCFGAVLYGAEPGFLCPHPIFMGRVSRVFMWDIVVVHQIFHFPRGDVQVLPKFAPAHKLLFSHI